MWPSLRQQSLAKVFYVFLLAGLMHMSEGVSSVNRFSDSEPRDLLQVHSMQRILRSSSFLASNNINEDKIMPLQSHPLENLDMLYLGRHQDSDLDLDFDLAPPAPSLRTQETLDLENKVKGLYSVLSNTLGLVSNQGGKGRDEVADNKEQGTEIYEVRKKRSFFDFVESRTVCPSKTLWQRLGEVKDMNDTLVTVVQPPYEHQNGSQWFHTVSCDHDHPQMTSPTCPQCCSGIDRRRYHSQCTTGKTFVRALVRDRNYGGQEWRAGARWAWIQLDSSCTCNISPVT